MLKGHDVSEALVGLDEEYGGIQYDHKAPSGWVLVERITDQGGQVELSQTKNLKSFAGEICPQSGKWWSPVNRSKS